MTGDEISSCLKNAIGTNEIKMKEFNQDIWNWKDLLLTVEFTSVKDGIRMVACDYPEED